MHGIAHTGGQLAPISSGSKKGVPRRHRTVSSPKPRVNSRRSTPPSEDRTQNRFGMRDVADVNFSQGEPREPPRMAYPVLTKYDLPFYNGHRHRPDFIPDPENKPRFFRRGAAGGGGTHCVARDDGLPHWVRSARFKQLLQMRKMREAMDWGPNGDPHSIEARRAVQKTMDAQTIPEPEPFVLRVPTFVLRLNEIAPRMWARRHSVKFSEESKKMGSESEEIEVLPGDETQQTAKRGSSQADKNSEEIEERILEEVTDAPEEGTESKDIAMEAPEEGTGLKDIATEAPEEGTVSKDIATEAPEEGTVSKDIAIEATEEGKVSKDIRTEAPEEGTKLEDGAKKASTQSESGAKTEDAEKSEPDASTMVGEMLPNEALAGEAPIDAAPEVKPALDGETEASAMEDSNLNQERDSEIVNVRHGFSDEIDPEALIRTIEEARASRGRRRPSRAPQSIEKCEKSLQRLREIDAGLVKPREEPVELKECNSCHNTVDLLSCSWRENRETAEAYWLGLDEMALQKAIEATERIVGRMSSPSLEGTTDIYNFFTPLKSKKKYKPLEEMATKYHFDPYEFDLGGVEMYSDYSISSTDLEGLEPNSEAPAFYEKSLSGQTPFVIMTPGSVSTTGVQSFKQEHSSRATKSESKKESLKRKKMPLQDRDGEKEKSVDIHFTLP